MIPAGSADDRLKQVVELGRAIKREIEQADLEAASELATRRLEHLRLLFSEPDPGFDPDDEMVAYWLQEILQEDRSLMQALDQLRDRMKLELGRLRNASRPALEYAEVERG